MANELSTIENWLVENGALFLRIDEPETELASARKVRSISEFRDVMAQVRTPGTEISISKEEGSKRRGSKRKRSSETITLRSYVKYADLFTPAHEGTILRWLREQGEVFVQIELPDTAGEGFYHVVDSLGALQQAVNLVQHPQVEIYIWKNPERAVPRHLVHSRPDEVLYLAVRTNPKNGKKARRRKLQ